MRAFAMFSVVGLLLAGCTSPKPQVTPDPVPSLPSAAPSVAPSPSPSAAPSPTAAPSGPPATPVCGGSLRGGANPHRAVMLDWLCRRPTLPQLGAVPRDIDMTWWFIRCAPNSGSSHCTYRNSQGSEIILRVPDSAPERVVDATFERTVYHTDAEQYTRHFIDAWVNGNAERMRALSSAAITSAALAGTPPSRHYTVTLSPAEVWIFEVTSSGGNYRVLLQAQLGRPGAITKVSPM